MSEDAGVTHLSAALSEYGEILTVAEIASVLRMREDTITNWLTNGQLRGIKLGRAWRIVKRDFLDDMAARYNTGPSHPDAGTVGAESEQ